MKTVFKCLSMVFFLFGLAIAQDLGVHGQIYEIVEPDMLDAIHARLIDLEQSGELEKQKQAFIKRAIQHVLRPKAVLGVLDIQPGEVAASHSVNPSIQVQHDILAQDGQIIARKGSTINPLDYMNFKEELVFINADNSDQVMWAIQYIKKNVSKVIKIILVRGNIKSTSETLGKVYFDQNGTLCTRFGIKRTPTKVFQPAHTKHLIVQEVQIG